MEATAKRRKADDRGRVNLGPEFADREVDVVVVERDDRVVAHVESDAE